MNDEQIQKILEQYKKQKVYRNNYYRKKYLEDNDYKQMKIQKAREHYINNNEARKERYNSEKPRINAERRYRYALKKGDSSVERFKKKYEEDYNLYIKDVFD